MCWSTEETAQLSVTLVPQKPAAITAIAAGTAANNSALCLLSAFPVQLHETSCIPSPLSSASAADHAGRLATAALPGAVLAAAVPVAVPVAASGRQLLLSQPRQLQPEPGLPLIDCIATAWVSVPKKHSVSGGFIIPYYVLWHLAVKLRV
jgi:hypothetical protein